jgi:DNA-binding MarR family transcriptional regulator
MQRLADELAADGLVEFIDNPKHRRSSLMRLTRKGEARYRELDARFVVIASTMGDELSEADISETAEIVRRLSDEAKGALGAASAEHEARRADLNRKLINTSRGG